MSTERDRSGYLLSPLSHNQVAADSVVAKRVPLARNNPLLAHARHAPRIFLSIRAGTVPGMLLLVF